MKNPPKVPYDVLCKVRLGGEYRMVLNEGTDRESSTPWFDNLVLDGGLDRLGQSATSPNCLQYCSVGTGSVAPAVGNTGLGAYLASVSNFLLDSGSNVGTPTYAGVVICHHTFAQGAVVGNITEVGMGWQTGGTGLFSRSLIVNGSGTPVALTVTALDVLTVYYKLTITPVITDSNSSVVISGTTYNFVARLANASLFQQSPNYSLTSEVGWGYVSIAAVHPAGCTIGAITAVPSGTTQSPATSNPRGSYTNGNFYADTVITWGPLAGNATGGVQGLNVQFMNYGGRWQWVFATVIPKDNTKTLTLTVRYAWGR